MASRDTGCLGPKVCFVADAFPPDKGCEARSAQRLVKDLIKLGYDMHVFVRADAPQGCVMHDEMSNLPVRRVPADTARLETALAFWNDRISFDLFHAFSIEAALACAPVAWRSGRSLIVNTGAVSEAWLENWEARAVLNAASWIVSDTAVTLSRIHRVVNVALKSSRIISLPALAGSPTWALSETNRGAIAGPVRPNPDPSLSLIGEIYAKVDRGLKSRLLLLEETRADRLIHSDEGAQSDWILRSFHIPNSEVQVARREIGECANQMHLFVAGRIPVTSAQLLEAAALGLPIVAPAFDGIDECFQSGRDCLIVSPGDSEALVGAVSEILADDQLANALSVGAYATARKLASDAKWNEYSRIYARMLDRRAALS